MRVLNSFAKYSNLNSTIRLQCTPHGLKRQRDTGKPGLDIFGIIYKLINICTSKTGIFMDILRTDEIAIALNSTEKNLCTNYRKNIQHGNYQLGC